MIFNYNCFHPSQKHSLLLKKTHCEIWQDKNDTTKQEFRELKEARRKLRKWSSFIDLESAPVAKSNLKSGHFRKVSSLCVFVLQFCSSLLLMSPNHEMRSFAVLPTVIWRYSTSLQYPLPYSCELIQWHKIYEYKLHVLACRVLLCMKKKGFC